MVNDQGERCRKASASLPLLYQWKKITTFAAAATFQANYCLDLQKFILTLILLACVMITVYGLIQPSVCRKRVKCYTKTLICMFFWPNTFVITYFYFFVSYSAHGTPPVNSLNKDYAIHYRVAFRIEISSSMLLC